MRFFCLFLCAATMASCSNHGKAGGDGSVLGGASQHEDDGGLGGGTEDSSAGSGVEGAVTGTRVVHFVTEGGEQTSPIDLSDTTIAALVAKSGGGYDSFMGTGAADGSFSIAGVPAGAIYFLRVGNVYVQTAERVVSLDEDRLGRKDCVPSTSTATHLTFNVGNMTAWKLGDDVQLYSPACDHAQYVYRFDGQPTNEPTDGATTLALNTGVWDGLDLIKGSLGDSAIGTHLTTATSGGGQSYLAVSESYTPGAFDMAEKQTSTVSGTFAQSGAATTVTLDWKRADFETLRTAIHPNAIASTQFGVIDAQPTGLSRGIIGATPDLAVFNPAPGTSDLGYGTVSFRNPFPSSWGTWFEVTDQFEVKVATATVPATIGVRDATSALAAAVRPSVTPARTPTVNGQDAFTARTGATLTPTLAWSAPATGTPTGYVVTALRIAGPAATPVATFYTKDTSLAVPPGALTMGLKYAFLITSVVEPTVDFAKAPFKKGLPYAYADTVTALVTP